jgi:hypothetical protein
MKTIAEIEAMTTRKLYYRSFEKARSIALTEAAKELGATVITASPFICVEYDGRKIVANDNGTFVLGLWARLNVREHDIYVQMNSNPFFPAYVTRSVILADKKTKLSHYAVSNGEEENRIYTGVDFNNTPETIERLKTNIIQEINRMIKTPFTSSNSYTKEISAFERKAEQTLYLFQGE